MNKIRIKLYFSLDQLVENVESEEKDMPDMNREDLRGGFMGVNSVQWPEYHSTIWLLGCSNRGLHSDFFL